MRSIHLELDQANAFVVQHHRHHKRVTGHRFSVGAVKKNTLIGVAIVGRPVGGANQDRWLEVTRLCTDGTHNACSFLYSVCAKAGLALGYERIQTFILSTEPATSLIAAGWEFDRMSHPVGWHHDSTRGARDVAEHLVDRKQLWFKNLNPSLEVELPSHKAEDMFGLNPMEFE